MHSAFNMLVFPNSMFTSLLLLLIFMKGLCFLRRNSTKKYQLLLLLLPKRKITPFDSVSPFESIPSLSTDACGVLSQLRRLNPNKARGPDELSPQLLILVSEELVLC